MTSPILEQTIAEHKPASLLDVGCGCGRHFTTALSGLCPRVVSIDIALNPSGWREVSQQTGVAFCAMDARALGFPSDTFPLVVERESLHHMTDWPRAISEMVRVSSDFVCIEEPIDDLRSDAKRRSYEAQGLLLRLQAEIRYPHYLHLDRDTLTAEAERQASLQDIFLTPNDTEVSFDEFFWSFQTLAAQSQREQFWFDQLDSLRSQFEGAPLCEADTLTLILRKT